VFISAWLHGDVTTSPRLLVSVSGLAPGAPLDAAVALADALDARRVPATLLAGPPPHPEVVAWASARRRVGDTVLLHGTRAEAVSSRPYRRLPAHEAGLRLVAALRRRDALGLAVDGFAAPGWSASAGTRVALAAAGLGLLLDDAGAHRLGPDGTILTSWRGPVAGPGARRTRRRVEPGLVHLAVHTGIGAATAGALVDEALAEGATPLGAGELAPRAPRRVAATGDPEDWSITA
jgi:predicted deacetylase